MLYDRTAARANIRNRDGKRVFYLGKGDQLTSDAKDFLRAERIEILSAELAKPDHYRLLCGGVMTEKPEHFTHLNAQVLVEKTHPRIRFRGAIDTLEAAIVLCAHEAQGKIRDQLSEVLALTRLLVRADVLEEAVPDLPLCGMRQDEIRMRSHRPQDFYNQAHFMPEPIDSHLLLLINQARCSARAAELVAAQAFTDANGALLREDILRAMNRLSSMLYLIMIEIKASSSHKE